VNKEIRKYNRSLFKITKAFYHAKFLELEGDRIFMRDILHFNKLGKAQLASK
jgi:hypothetical protein